MFRKVCCFAVMFSVPALACAQAETGLVAHWDFNEGKGDVFTFVNRLRHHWVCVCQYGIASGGRMSVSAPV